MFGAGNIAQPHATARSNWIGRAARKPGAQVMIRSQGVRDLVLGAGAIAAATRSDPSELRHWMLGHTASDLTDFVATLVALDDLPKRRGRFALTVAGISTVVAATSAATARPQPD